MSGMSLSAPARVFPSCSAAYERNFWHASLLAVGLVVVFHSAFWLRMQVLPSPDDPTRLKDLLLLSSEAAMRYVALPHFVIGFLCLVTAAKNRTAKRRLLIATLLILGVIVSLVYRYVQDHAPVQGKHDLRYLVRTGTNVWMLFAIIPYFLIHELRDQAFFYTTLGGTPSVPGQARFAQFVRHLIALIVGAILAGIWAFAVIGKVKTLPSVPASMPVGLKLCVAAAPLPLVLAAAYFIPCWYVRGTSWSVSDAFSHHAPLLRVFAGVFFWVVAGFSTGTGFYLVILLHVMGWYVFTCHMLAARPTKSAPEGWWPWMRTTLPGFRVLHIGMVLGLLAFAFVWVWAFGREGWVWWAISPQTLYYWTIIHITVSFVPR
jgi:hypothetical protein